MKLLMSGREDSDLIYILFVGEPMKKEKKNYWFVLFGRHLIGFFLFLFLTVYTAMKVPDVADISPLQNLHDMLQKADFHKIHLQLMNCLPSLPNIPDLQKFKTELKSSLLSMEFLSTLSGNIMERLTACLSDQITRMYHVVDDSVQVMRLLLGFKVDNNSNL